MARLAPTLTCTMQESESPYLTSYHLDVNPSMSRTNRYFRLNKLSCLYGVIIQPCVAHRGTLSQVINTSTSDTLAPMISTNTLEDRAL